MSKDTLKDALAEFEQCRDAEGDNRSAALEDIKFTFLDDQWPESAKKQREVEGRPCLTINKTRQFVKQVVNNGRQNKPSIKVHPADSQADVATARIIDGLIRNIEYTSNADVAYDTGFEFAVAGGFGYWRVAMDYAHDDTFDMDLLIQRVANPFSIYGDPFSTAADSSDWNIAFITDPMSHSAFEEKWKGADKVDWAIGEYADLPINWRDGDKIIVAERWKRVQVMKKLLKLSDGQIMEEREYLKNKDIFDVLGMTVEGDREAKGYKVTQDIMTGAEVLETNDWPGKYIPIVPVYGEELNIEGVRHFRSLIRSGKDAQMMFNYWRTATTEMVALSPKAPFIGAKGAFNTDSDKWGSANTQTHAYIEYDVVPGATPPQRQGFTGPPAGALQEALNASDDMKAIYGMYDASMGARSNETSGVAINQRKMQGDMSNFHFVDNQARAIGHTGRILIDLIPHVYSQDRIVRVMGQDSKPQNVRVNAPQESVVEGSEQIYNLSLGKYDLTVTTGPGFATQREESAAGMTELMRAVPQTAIVIAPHLAKAQDWPDADKIAEELAALAPNANGQNPAVQQLQQQLQQQDQHAKEAVGQLQQQVQQAQAALNDKAQDNQFKSAELELKSRELAIKEQEAQAKLMDAETKRMQAMVDAQTNAMSAQNASQPQEMPMEQPDMTDGEKLVYQEQQETQRLEMKLAAERQNKILDAQIKLASTNTDPYTEYDADFVHRPNQDALQGIASLHQTIESLKEIIASPKELIFDQNNRPIGSRIVLPPKPESVEIEVADQAPSGAFFMPEESQSGELEG